VSQAFHPRFGENTFTIPYYELDPKNTRLLTAKYSNETEVILKKGSDKISLFIHPDMEIFARAAIGRKPDNYILGAPTSSTRTLVFLEECPGLMVKTHLNRRISRFIRRLSENSIYHSIQVTNELQKASTDPNLPHDFGFFAESAGIIYKDNRNDEGWGCLIRERKAEPAKNWDGYAVPLFSLYSLDSKSQEDKPILIQLGDFLNRDPFDILIENVVEPLICGWAFIYLNYGLILESHGQNTLLEIDDNFLPRRIIHRDFQSIPVDGEIRRSKGLRQIFDKHVIGQEDYPNFLEQSLMYDHFIGDYLFKFFEGFSVDYLGRSREKFRAIVKSIFRKYVPNQHEYFPKEHVVLKDGLAKDNAYELILADGAPVYR
jgi:hypothetical protein